MIRQTQYTFRARLADQWRQDRIFLLGDAAHQTPPFIGQGLCAGLRDAYNLSWKLAHVPADGADERLLDSYEGERRPHARHLIRLAVAMGWAMTGGQDQAATVRRAVLGAAYRVPGLTAFFAGNLNPALAAGPLVHRDPLAGNRLVGSTCPQPYVMVDGCRMLLDDALGDSFALLTAAPPTPAVRAVADGLGARVVHVRGGPADVHPGDAVVADDGTLAAWLRRGRALAVLLRPDRVVLDTVSKSGGLGRTTAWAPLLTAPARPRP